MNLIKIQSIAINMNSINTEAKVNRGTDLIQGASQHSQANIITQRTNLMKILTQKNKPPLLAASFILITAFLIFTIYQEAPIIFMLSLLCATVIFATLSHHLHWFKLDDRQLFKQPLFIIATAYPCYLFILFGTWIWKDYNLSLSREGYSIFLENSKFPLIMLASSVPLGAIVNNIHRTIQTEKQIHDAGEKNRNDIYYGHVKFILDQFDKIKGKQISNNFIISETNTTYSKSEAKNWEFKMDSSIFIKQPMDLYRKVYKNSRPQKNSNFQVCPDFLRELRDEWLKIYSLCLYREKWEPEPPFMTPQELRLKVYSDIDIAYTNICNLLCLGGFHSENSIGHKAKKSDWNWISTFSTCSHMYDSLRSLATVTELIMDRVRDENVDLLFPSNKSIFNIGSGFVTDFSMYFDNTLVTPYQPPSINNIFFIDKKKLNQKHLGHYS